MHGGHGFNPWVGKTPWRREQLPTPVFLPGEFQGQRSLAGSSPWGYKESDTTEPLSLMPIISSKYWKTFYNYLWIDTAIIFEGVERNQAENIWGHGEGNGTALQYSCLENTMDGGAWWAAVHGVAKSRTRLSDFTFTFHFHALEKEMETHSSALAWRIPGTGDPGGLLSMGSPRVGQDWSDLAAAAGV